jgi:uncharacterized protein (DUF1800 family)
MGDGIGRTPWQLRSWAGVAGAAVLGLALAGCGGGSEGPEPSGLADEAVATAEGPQAAGRGSLSPLGAYRLADQATFGASEKLLTELGKASAEQWISSQFAVAPSRYTRGGSNAIHTYTGSDFCADNATPNCWNFYYSSQPLAWDFYRNAVNGPDQLRQRVALALSQINVVSQLEIEGTYGLRNWHNNFIANAFGNYRAVLKSVALSPVMGDYLNNVNNNKTAPNENFARELLQLFAIGTCELELDGRLKGGKCQPTYDNTKVREYAFALTGWTYPPGGRSVWCAPRNGVNCRFYDGNMVPRAAAHDSASRTLLSAVSVPAGSTADAALEAVLDSLMAHPNMAPFIGRQLIQHLVTSNPSPGYVARVSYAFNTGRYGRIGSGVRGDLRATVAAILLDAEARGDVPPAQAGRLREPVQFFAGVLRALNGTTDGDPLTWWWGEALGQHVFRPPSVFNYYRPDYPVAGTPLQGPQFGILNANTGLARVNYVNYLVNWGGSAASASVPEALPTQVNLDPFLTDASDPARLVDRMARVGLGGRITPAARQTVINAVAAWNAGNSANYLKERVKTAAYLVFASPQYHIAR